MPVNPELTILYEDNHCLAVAKPAPLLTQGVPPGVPTLETMVESYIKDRYHKPGNVYLGIPHRLDRPVSGVVVFARNTKAAQRLAEQFQQRQVRKVYWAVVEPNAEGGLPTESGVWEDWLLKIQDEARTRRVAPETPGVKRRCCVFVGCRRRRTAPCWKSSRRRGGCTRSASRRRRAAGRCAAISCTDARLPFGPPAELPRDRVIALHARSLTFLHPIRYEPLTVTAPAPEAWRPWVRENT